jgi:hypothetical protein
MKSLSTAGVRYQMPIASAGKCPSVALAKDGSQDRGKDPIVNSQKRETFH